MSDKVPGVPAGLEPGHKEPTTLDQTEYVDEKGASDVQEEEEEPVVTFKTWIVVFILSMGYGLSFWPIPVMAAIETQIATELGEPQKVGWFIPAWTLSITVCFMICGANTDLLGRRWFLVGGNVFCFIGHLVVGSAKSANAVIIGMAFSGFGGGNCQMAAFALSELLPNKWRHIGVVIADFSTLMAVIVAPVSGRYGWETNTWQWNFYGAAIMQGLSFLGLFFLYYPPAHPYNMDPRQVIKKLDYLGMFLFIAGAVPVLMGIVWTNIYPSSDAHVVAPLVVGFVFLIAFALWETYGNIAHPLTPSYMFTASYGRDLTAPCIALAVVNMFYYSSSILWPTMISVFYTDGDTDWRYGILLSIVQGFAITTGAVLLSVFGSRLRHWNWTLTGSVVIMVLFGTLLALGTPNRKGMMIAFVFLSQTGYGWAIYSWFRKILLTFVHCCGACYLMLASAQAASYFYLSIAISQMGVEHKDLGHSGGISGVSRFAAGTIATSVYTTILTNTVTKYTLRYVPAAVEAAGLAASKVPALLKDSTSPTFAKDYPAAVVAAYGGAVQLAYEKGIQYVAYTSLAFGMVGVIACICCKDVDHKMNNKIEVYLENDVNAARNAYH